MKNRLLITRRARFNPFLSKTYAAAVTMFHHQRALQNSIRDVNQQIKKNTKNTHFCAFHRELRANILYLFS